MARNRLGDRRTLRFSGAGTFLPNVGPFAGLGKVNYLTLPNYTLSSTGPFFSSDYLNPTKANTITISGVTSITGTSIYSYIWCNKLVFTGGLSAIEVSGYDGDSIFGQDGGSGGGGGSDVGFDGGNGGDIGGDGASGQGFTSGYGGTGLGQFFAWGGFGPGGNGTQGQDDTIKFAGTGGIGDTGCGGGGGGGPGSTPGLVNGAGGAGGGAGCVVVCNELIGFSGGIAFRARGGEGYDSFSSVLSSGGGGGGCLWIATRKYNGATAPQRIQYTIGGGGAVYGSYQGTDGTFEMYQISGESTLTAKTNFQSWG